MYKITVHKPTPIDKSYAKYLATFEYMRHYGSNRIVFKAQGLFVCNIPIIVNFSEDSDQIRIIIN